MEIVTHQYERLISVAQKLSHPRVLINICSHGNETIGLKVKALFPKMIPTHLSVTFHVANPEAVKQGKRFIESDLNRSFPGSLTGTKEEIIAAHMMEYISNFDYVFDIHSTVSDVKDCIIIEDDSDEVQRLLTVTKHARTVLHMTATRGTSIFTATRTTKKIIPAIAFEYGDNSDEVAQKVSEDLFRMLAVIAGNESAEEAITAPDQYECYKIFLKNENDVLADSICNYKIVLKGQVVGYAKSGEEIIAPEDFYPILFGETSYTTMFGFMGRKVML